MSQAQPRPAAPNPKRNVKAIRTVRFWMAPIATTLALMSALAALYLGGILNPMTNLRHFPIALVNEDAGPAGQQIVDGLVSGLDKNKFDIRVVSPDEARRLLDTAAVYGSALIPPTFSSQLRDFGASAVTPTSTDRPAITISTNPRAGTLAASIAGQTLTRALTVTAQAQSAAVAVMSFCMGAEFNFQGSGRPILGLVGGCPADVCGVGSEHVERGRNFRPVGNPAVAGGLLQRD